ncbi:umuDC operon protein-like protein [Aquipseudomonas alcaligenes OT 69]|nr:umuDC operon protein-like protein [Pseudomonas alcaligenes OT 69]
MEKRINFNELLNANAPQVYTARAMGDSMQGIGLYDGDLMVVDRSLEVRPGAIVIAAINGEVFVKRFCREQGNIVLRSENPAYKPRFIMEGDELEIWGVVTHNLRDQQHG